MYNELPKTLSEAGNEANSRYTAALTTSNQTRQKWIDEAAKTKSHTGHTTDLNSLIIPYNDILQEQCIVYGIKKNKKITVLAGKANNETK